MHSQKYFTCDIEERLSLLHDVQVILRMHLKDRKNLIEHLTMLASNANAYIELIRMVAKLLYKGAHLDRFRASTEYHKDFFHRSAFSRIDLFIYYTNYSDEH